MSKVHDKQNGDVEPNNSRTSKHSTERAVKVGFYTKTERLLKIRKYKAKIGRWLLKKKGLKNQSIDITCRAYSKNVVGDVNNFQTQYINKSRQDEASAAQNESSFRNVPFPCCPSNDANCGCHTKLLDMS